MPGVDWIPGVSQAKSFSQLLTGDIDGAARTQKNFAKECPLVSQVTSVVQAISGDTQGALETQKRCLGTVNNIANGIPLVGHVKGGVHHVFGDHEGRNEALQAATRSSVVIGTGVAVGRTSGEIAAIAAAIVAGSAYDMADTFISERPKGFFAAVRIVADNPNAGNIFDAAAVVVGDGLAGYSAGQIGEQMNTQVEITKFNASRPAIMEQLNAGMYAEEGAANSVASGQIDEINMYAAETNPLSLWKGPSNISVSIGESNKQENAMEADCYVEEIEDCLNPQQKEARKNFYIQQKSGKATLNQIYPNTITITNEDCDKMNKTVNRDQDDPSRNPTEEMVKPSHNLLWMHVQMPPEFGYTGAILANETFNGLLHSFIRHPNQWLNCIPGLRHLIDELVPMNIWELIQQVQDAPNPATATIAINNLNRVLKIIPYKIYDSLLAIQLKLREFLRRNVTSAQYLGEGVNNRGLIQVYFEVTNSSGAREVMVVCVSNQLFPSVPEFGDPRPVRTITTVFFKPWHGYENSPNCLGRAWP